MVQTVHLGTSTKLGAQQHQQSQTVALTDNTCNRLRYTSIDVDALATTYMN